MIRQLLFRRRSGSIPALRLNCRCWLMGQGDGPVLLARPRPRGRQAGREKASTLLGLPFWRFCAATCGDACDELEVGHQVSSRRGLREAEDIYRPVVQPPSFLHTLRPSLSFVSFSSSFAPTLTPLRTGQFRAGRPANLLTLTVAGTGSKNRSVSSRDARFPQIRCPSTPSCLNRSDRERGREGDREGGREGERGRGRKQEREREREENGRGSVCVCARVTARRSK